MLDTATKHRIDTARDILVGKVPDPKSQVEQITISLIYKFMDDMDAEAAELGGARTFFSGAFAEFGWAKLMRTGLGGHEMLALYSKALDSMPQNPGVPQLFRDIFKNAYLPYKDPETLRAFLKIIDEFDYDHSERLGDAFEYLLSVLGSQGDAGQFRTPRHVIDFMIEVVDPKKNESVLDPACGTAGFLISSYKHILRANTDKHGTNTLTPDEREHIARSFTGYDISPDMVRLSLVNMYLHGFTLPRIYEYDTLTSQDRWNDYADVILANPPFMSPKGGIIPHNRFSVQSKRSEVLFVDYMAEHLKPNGRAAIIVPEGIIFQSQNAYTQLRKMLVEDSLVAVVSLPAGVFNPYSGVKTSILILDKALAKRTPDIAFVKIGNDGFGLGAQRRAIEKNDLPQALEALKEFIHMDRQDGQDKYETSCKSCSSMLKVLIDSGKANLVPKAKIAANGDYNLSGERYVEGAVAVSAWPFVSVGNVFKKGDQTVLPESLKGPVTYLGLENITQNTGKIEGFTATENPAEIKSLKNVFKPRDILYGKLRPNLNKVWLADRKGICSTDIFVIEAIETKADPALYAYLFRSALFNNAVMSQLKGAQLPRIGWTSFAELQIPLPPLDIQKQIVAEIEGYQKIIDGARAVVDNYRPHIDIDPSWPMVELGEVIVGKPKNGYSGKPVDHITETKVLTLTATTSGKLDLTKFKYLDEIIAPAAPCRCQRGDIYLQRGNTAELVGTAALFDSDAMGFIYPDLMIRVRADISMIVNHFLLIVLQSQPARDFLVRNAVGAAGSMPKINQGIVERIPIPLPPLDTQRSIVAEIEAEQALVTSTRELITRFEKKIQAVLAKVWGE